MIVSAVTYAGFSKDAWDLAFGMVNLLVILVGVPIAVRTLRQSVLQKLNDSLARLLEEYRGADFRDSVRHTIDKFPIFEGTTLDKVSHFLEYGSEHLCEKDMLHARAVVHKLNDLGAFVDRQGVREQDFYGHMYPRLIELSARLDPLILAVSSRNGYRWGMRVRRLGRGASAYYSASALHSKRPFVLDNATIVAAGRTGWSRRVWIRIRGWFGLRMYTPSAVAILAEDEVGLADAGLAIRRASPEASAFISRVA